MLALDFLRVAFAWAVLVGVEVTRVGPPIIETVVTLNTFAKDGDEAGRLSPV
jgi:hypothetical protein